MARTKTYAHFCPVARTLEVIGEKWSLLIVRDLLRGPQRFTDLQRYLGGITPKWLTLRLRELEAAGIVAAERVTGRREVWYRLTEKGTELAPVVQALAVWGIDHTARPPSRGEPVHIEQMLASVAAYRNARGVRLRQPATWLVRLTTGSTATIRFGGERWTVRQGEHPADLTIEATPEAWVAFHTAPPDERRERATDLRIDGTPEQVADFLDSFAPEEVLPAASAAAERVQT